MKTILLFASALLAILPISANAHAGLIEVKVISLKKMESEYLLELEPQNLEHLPKRMTIHLRFNPDKAAFAASQKKEDFDDALKDLEAAVNLQLPISIAVMSGVGFNPIKKRPGHYRSEMIQRVDWFKQPNVVCFFHSDHYAEAPK